MKKISLLLLFSSIGFIGKIAAQPTFWLAPEQVVVDENEQVCLSVNTRDFTDLIEISFTLQWDAGVLDFDGISNINPSVTGLDMGDFDLSMAADGIVTFHWSTGMPCNAATTGVTLPSNQEPHELFEICFTATGVYGKHTPVVFTDDPVDKVVKRVSSNCNDIGEVTEDGFISIGTPPLTMNVSSGDGFTGDVVCVDFKVEDFDDLVSFQYGIFWDPNVLEYQSAVTSNLPNFISPPSINNIGTTQVGSGILNVIWYVTTNEGVTVPDGTQILQVCFNIVGDCGQSSTVYLAPNPPEPIEVINAITSLPISGVNIGLLQEMGTVTVNCFNPDGITLDIDDKDVCPGENFTVDVKVSDFQDIVKLQFNLKWNPGIINITNVTYPMSAPCTPFSGGVDPSEFSQGVLKMDWASFGLGCDLNDGFTLMRLHFTTVGSSGSNSTIAVTNPILVDKFGGMVDNIGINNNNGLVSVCELSSPTIIASSANAEPGDEICIDFSVKDFDEITRTQYTIAWEPNVLQFLGVQDFNLTNLTASNFIQDQALSLGVLGVEWENGTPVTLPDGAKIFKVCFKVIGDPDECSGISFDDLPWAIDIQTGESSGTNVGLNGQPGQVCVENPFIFGLNFPEVYAGPGSTVCLDVTVNNFIQLTETQYAINWNPNIIQYQNIQLTGGLPGFSASSYDDNSALTSGGNLIVDWVSPNQVQGTSVPNGTSIFQICFDVVGFSTQCSQVNASNFPVQFIITSAPTGDANLTLTSDAGSVCVSSTLNLVDALIVPVECPSAPTGMIDITVSGGSGNFQYQWSGPGVSAANEDQVNLGAGDYLVTVTDVQNPSLDLELEFEVGYSPDAMVAHAGVDTSFSCENFPFITLNGTNSIMPPGGDVTLNWKSIAGSGIIVSNQGTLTPTAVGGQCWELTITNNISGCVDKDTVCVSSPQYPVPEAGDTRMITCLEDTIILDGNLSPFGFDTEWSTVGGNIVPGTETFLTPKVTQPGWYFITQTDPDSGCQGMDSVLVEINVEEPVADAGPAAILGCNDQSVQIGGLNTSAGAEFIYDWVPMQGGDVCGDENAALTQACAAGTYQLVVTDTTNGCTSMSEIEVMADTLKPVAQTGPDTVLTCLIGEIMLNGAGSSANGDFVYNWTFTGSGNIVSGQGTLTPVVDAPATYQLEVTDTSNGCKAISDVIVIDNQIEPEAVASVSNAITCSLGQATLAAAGSATGSNIAYQWLDGAGMQIGTDDTLVVNTPDDYMLVVTNMANGCSKTAGATVDNLTSPPVVNAGDQADINCYGDPQLEGSTEAGNLNLILNWSGPGLGCIQDNGTLTPTVSCPGTYTLTVQDTLTGCIGQDQVLVGNDEVQPVVNAGPDTSLTCANDAIMLQGSANVTDILVSWSSIPASLPITDGNTLTPTISEPGTYTLSVTSVENGCSKTDIVIVIADNDGPVADAGEDGTTDCQNVTDLLSAANSTLVNTSLTWNLLPNSPGISSAVELEAGPGVYELVVVDSGNGCEARDTVEIVDNAELPQVVVVEELELTCDGSPVNLDGTGSTSGQGITYLWTDENGEITSSEIIAPVTAPGVYTLTVFNSNNSCVDSAQTQVVQIVSGPPAEAMVDHDPCDAEAMLVGNLPNGATGTWTSGTGASIDDPNASATLASGLQAGENSFTWTLSLGSCLNYTSASVTLELEQAPPNAVDDIASLTAEMAGTVTVDVLENDVFEDATFNLIPSAGIIGTVAQGENGEIVFAKEKCFVGKVEIPYEICDNTCTELCDTAVLIINVEPDPTAECDEVPNGITPNGDGVNDELIFDVLLNNPPDEFPDNEIIIFNRWGDIVYQARPYNNDWRGTNQNGNDLPHGTYYYILRLSIADGNIIRGDVTILK